MHARKTALPNKTKLRFQKAGDEEFIVPVKAFDGAKSLQTSLDVHLLLCDCGSHI